MGAAIAGLVCAAEIARKNGAKEDSERYLHVADDWAAHLEKWLVTTAGHLGGPQASQGYYILINNNLDPNDGDRLDLSNSRGGWGKSTASHATLLHPPPHPT